MVCSFEWFIPIKLFLFPSYKLSIISPIHMGMSRINPTVIVVANQQNYWICVCCLFSLLVGKQNTCMGWTDWYFHMGHVGLSEDRVSHQMPTVKKGNIMRIHWILMSSQEKPLDAAQIESWGPNRSSKRFQACALFLGVPERGYVKIDGPQKWMDMGMSENNNDNHGQSLDFGVSYFLTKPYEWMVVRTNKSRKTKLGLEV